MNANTYRCDGTLTRDDEWWGNKWQPHDDGDDKDITRGSKHSRSRSWWNIDEDDDRLSPVLDLDICNVITIDCSHRHSTTATTDGDMHTWRIPSSTMKYNVDDVLLEIYFMRMLTSQSAGAELDGRPW
jgi:hypothetical protein